MAPLVMDRAGDWAPRRVVVVKPCCIGDVLLATPLLASLRAAWPGARFDWAVGNHSRGVLEGQPHVDGLLDATGCVRGELRVRSIGKLILSMRRGRYDLAVVPDRSPIVNLLPWLARVPRRVGLDSGGRGWPNTVRVHNEAHERRAEVDVYLDIARALGVPLAEPRPLFVPTAAHRAEAEELLGTLGPHRPRVALHVGGGVNPGMALPEKRWPAERFGQLAGRLAEIGAAVVWLGGPGDTSSAARARATEVFGLGHASEGDAPQVDGCGRLSLGGTAAVVATCDAYVGSDTGVSHLAVAVGTSAVVVFGPTDPVRYGPREGAGVAVVAAYDSPFERLRDARGSTAIEEVTVDAVWRALQTLLEGGTGPTSTKTTMTPI